MTFGRSAAHCGRQPASGMMTEEQPRKKNVTATMRRRMEEGQSPGRATEFEEGEKV